MTDSDGRIIPHLDEDMGEGVKDPVDDLSEIRSLFLKEEQRLPTVEGPSKKDLPKGEKLDLILDEIRALNHKLDLIFGTHVLVKGRWEPLRPLMTVPDPPDKKEAQG